MVRAIALSFPFVTQSLLEQLSGLATGTILLASLIHLLAFTLLWVWAGRDFHNILVVLDDFTRGLQHRSVLDRQRHHADQIDAFIADVNDVVSDEGRQADRDGCRQRINILDERRSYLDSMAFATSYNICRTMIEAYPLAGVLGTILAIGAALNGASNAEAADAASTLSAIVGHFGDAIWSTFAGLCAAILLMFVNSSFETRFQRLSDQRDQVRELIARVKRELSWSTSGSGKIESANEGDTLSSESSHPPRGSRQ